MKKDIEYELMSENTKLRTVIISILVLLFGIFVIYLGNLLVNSSNKENLSNVVKDVGSFLIGSGTLGIIWELVAKKSFFREIWKLNNISDDIKSSGILEFTSDFKESVDWSDLFSHASNIDIFFSYGNTWTNNNIDRIRSFSRKNKRGKINLFIPDINNDDIISELSRRYSITNDELINKINYSIESIKNAHKKTKVIYIKVTPVYTFYRFDNKAVIALYKHRRDKEPVPTFVVKKGGELYNFITTEIDGFLTDPTIGRHEAP